MLNINRMSFYRIFIKKQRLLFLSEVSAGGLSCDCYVLFSLSMMKFRIVSVIPAITGISKNMALYPYLLLQETCRGLRKRKVERSEVVLRQKIRAFLTHDVAVLSQARVGCVRVWS
jgi:hypothetical protein